MAGAEEVLSALEGGVEACAAAGRLGHQDGTIMMTVTLYRGATSKEVTVAQKQLQWPVQTKRFPLAREQIVKDTQQQATATIARAVAAAADAENRDHRVRVAVPAETIITAARAGLASDRRAGPGLRPRHGTDARGLGRVRLLDHGPRATTEAGNDTQAAARTIAVRATIPPDIGAVIEDMSGTGTETRTRTKKRTRTRTRTGGAREVEIVEADIGIGGDQIT